MGNDVAQDGRVLTYYEAYASTGEYSRRYPKPNPHTWAFLLENLDGSGPVLDAGCGNGRYTIALAAQGWVMHGVDLSAEMVKEARLRAEGLGISTAKFDEADITKLPFPDGMFSNVVLLFGVLSHLRTHERVQAVREMRRVLRPGGLLVVSVPNRYRYSFHNQLRTFAKRILRGNPDHLVAGDILYRNRMGGKSVENFYHLFTPRELRLLLGDNGFVAGPVRGEAMLAETATVKHRLGPMHRVERRLLRRSPVAAVCMNLLCAARAGPAAP